MKHLHTVTPWQCSTFCVWGKNDEYVAGVMTGLDADTQAANAAHIVMCVNSHESLLNMLQRMVDETSGGATPCLLTLEQARAALAKVQSC